MSLPQPSPALSRQPTATSFPLPPRGVNWTGAWTLYVKETRRFLVVATQTVAAPCVTTLLFLAVFLLALGQDKQVVSGVPFAMFLAPGLVIMAMAQNAFANTSSSLVISKVQGNIVDLLMPPLSAGEITVAMAASGVTRGLLVGVVTTLAMVPFAPMLPARPDLVLAHGLLGSLMMSLLGILAGLWSEKFDHIAAVTNFLVTPLTFLSGTFYSIARLPEPWATIAYLNPFFYLIDGFRHGFIGHGDAPVATGLVVMLVVDTGLALAAWLLLKRGYKVTA